MGISGFEVEGSAADRRCASAIAVSSIGASSRPAAGGLPPIQAFDPLHLPKVLRNIWIVEVEGATQRFRVRWPARTSTRSMAGTSAASISAMCMIPSDLETIVARYSRCLAAAGDLPRHRLGLRRRRQADGGRALRAADAGPWRL
jgi:hypothetical protein